jgi:hypothetical protein
MKKLQNSFTNPEQSKRLLELGVPADSADCYNTTKHIGKIPDGATYKDVWQMSIWRDENGNHIEMYPCWSVGRLMEIYGICSRQYTHNMWLQDALTCILAYIEFAFDYGNIDFSKLEE